MKAQIKLYNLLRKTIKYAKLKRQKVRARPKFGFFCDAFVLKKSPGVNPKVRVRLKLGFLRY